MTEAARTIAQQQLIIWALVIVILVLLACLTVAVHELREKDLDGKLARGRRKQRRMEQHPKRVNTPFLDALFYNTQISADAFADALFEAAGMSEERKKEAAKLFGLSTSDENGGPE